MMQLGFLVMVMSCRIAPFSGWVKVPALPCFVVSYRWCKLMFYSNGSTEVGLIYWASPKVVCGIGQLDVISTKGPGTSFWVQPTRLLIYWSQVLQRSGPRKF